MAIPRGKPFWRTSRRIRFLELPARPDSIPGQSLPPHNDCDHCLWQAAVNTHTASRVKGGAGTKGDAIMSTRRRASALVFAALLAGGAAAILFTNVAMAQTVGGDTIPPLPDDDEQGEPGVTPPEALPPTQTPDETTFEEGLSPYGRWVDSPEYGRVWVPSDTGPDWQPYTDGRWVDTDLGWSFASSVPWGWAVFHYGRWGFGLGLGWFWVPGFVWAPAWVSWRYYPGFVCWSPFAPRGFVFGSHWPGWIVLPARHFTHPIARFVVPRAHAAPIIRAANPVVSIASSRAHGNFPGVRTFRGGGNVRGSPALQGGGTIHGGRAFHRSTFRTGGAFRRGENFVGRGTSRGAGTFRGWPLGGGRSFAGSMRSSPVGSRGFDRIDPAKLLPPPRGQPRN